MIVEKGKSLLYAWCARGPFDALRNFLDLVARVAIVITLPRLLGPPPRLCVATVSSKIKQLADRREVLPDGRSKLRFVDQHLAGPIFVQQGSNRGAILAPTVMSKLDDLGII